jgi:hypothetical protein
MKDSINCRFFIGLIVSGFLCLSTQNLYSANDFPNKLSYSVDRGFYQQKFDVELTIDTTNAIIKYTLDGSDPSTSASAKIAPAPVTIRIDPDDNTDRFTAPGVCLRAVGYAGTKQITRVKTHTYLFVDKVIPLSPDGARPGTQWPLPNSSGNNQYMDYGMDPQVCNDSRYKDKMIDVLRAIPTISIVTDLKNLFDPSTGIYMNAFGRGIDWERPASVELLKPDGSDGFQVNCGIRIRGGWSRHPDNPKHAFRLFFRAEYGDNQLKYPLFGDEGASEFDKVDLRTSQNYSWAYKGEGTDTGRHNTMLRDVFSRDTQRDMSVPYTRSRYYHLYINGVYWGLFQTQERPEAAFARTYFGGNQEDYDVIKREPEGSGIEASDGNMEAWTQLWEIARKGFYSDTDYYRVQGLNPDGTRNPAYPVLVDIDNLICYMLCTFYVGDYDGPISAFGSNNFSQNWFGIYNRVHPDGFKFFRHDAEHTMFLQEGGIPGAGIDRTGPYPAGNTLSEFNPQWLHQQLTNHPEYILRFTDFVYKFFFNDGVLTPEPVINRIQKRREQIELAIIAESARWGDSKVSQPRTYHKDWLPAVNFLINDYAPVRTDMVLNQFKAKGWYPDVEPPKFSHPGGVIPKGTQVTITANKGTIYYTLDGSDPHLPTASGNFNTYTLFDKNARKYALVPQSDIGTNWRSEINYNVTGWDVVTGDPGGIGYEAGSGFENLISLDVKDKMYDPNGSNPTANTCCYIRISFTVTSEVLGKLTSLIFKSQYDDGIVVYLNGTKILEDNVPTNPAWNSTALSAIQSEMDEKTFNVSDHLDKLVVGDNLLAIHALNFSRPSSDFLVIASLVATDKINSGGISGSAIPYTGSITFDQSGSLKARVLNDKGWSALVEVNYWVLEDVHELRITEIHYHPLDEGVEDNDSEYEFIELKNMGVAEYDLNQVRFSKGITYNFPAGKKMQDGEILVLASNAESFARRYGFQPYGIYQGKLDNSGENLILEGANGDTLVHIRYNDRYPWPISADGDGYSMVVRSDLPGVDIARGTNWRRSSKIHGSPGEDDLATDIEQPNSDNKISTFKLFQNYPNPFNPSTVISYQLPVVSRVTLKVYDILGREAATLIDEVKQPGFYQVAFSISENRRVAQFSSGLYLIRLQAGNFSQTKKMILIK